MDPFEFSEPEYDHTANNFSNSFTGIFRDHSDHDDDFEGFEREDIELGVGSRVVLFHHRRDEER